MVYSLVVMLIAIPLLVAQSYLWNQYIKQLRSAKAALAERGIVWEDHGGRGNYTMGGGHDHEQINGQEQEGPT